MIVPIILATVVGLRANDTNEHLSGVVCTYLENRDYDRDRIETLR